MTPSEIKESLLKKITQIYKSAPAQDLEKNARALMTATISKMNLVSREEFDVQRTLLERAREQLTLLEARISELESRLENRSNSSGSVRQQ